MSTRHHGVAEQRAERQGTHVPPGSRDDRRPVIPGRGVLLTMPRSLVVAFALLVAGCAMRVTGTVRDRGTGYPIGGAIVTVNDGRDRMAVSDGNGDYALKTDWRPATLAVTASGFRSAEVPVPGDDRYPVIDVELDRAERLNPAK